jgi:ADP-ribose pyrophosphatase YjhB (NUDIX family)
LWLLRDSLRARSARLHSGLLELWAYQLPQSDARHGVKLEDTDALGLLVIRRSIPPKEGQLALPGGFISYGESWQTGAVREVMEETGLQLEAESIRLASVLSAPDSTILIFGIAPVQAVNVLEGLSISSETSEVTVLKSFAPLAFPLHTQVAQEFFDGKFR